MIRRDDEALLTPREVAEMFRVSPARVAIWARAGLIGSVVTPTGRRRYRAAEVAALLASRREEAT